MAIHRNFDARRLAVFSILVATCTSVQLTPRPPGLEFTSLLTFSSGVVFGAVVGAFLGAMVMFVNAFLSPVGLAGLNMPFQMLGMGFIGLVGGFYKMEDGTNARFYVEAAVLGAFLTLVYYFITNLGFALTLALPPSQISLLEAVLIAQVSGALFTALYVFSNTLLFGTVAVPLVTAMRKLLRR